MNARVLRQPAATLTSDAGSILDLLRRHAEERPDAIAMTFLKLGGVDEVNLTYRELDRRTRVVADSLAKRVRRGSRVLLVHAPGVDYFVAFLGILRAGAIAVPVYPPDINRLRVGVERMQFIARDANPELVLTSSAFAAMKGALANDAPGLLDLEWLASDADDGSADPTEATDDRRSDIAFIQYTSGSTGTPRGVVIRHRNVLSNLELIHSAARETDDGRCVLWLPPYHDMGLINQIYALAVGMRCVLLSPVHFLARPVLWLEAITRYRATYSGGPNFAYDLVTRKTDEGTRASLDLSGWRCAFNGAEPIRAETLARFADAFGPCGFSSRAFVPCYGLAEATVCVSGKMDGGDPVVRVFDSDALARGEAVPEGADGEPSPRKRLVACGRTSSDHHVRIVDADKRLPAAAGKIGEIWFRGPSVGGGYWGDPEKSHRTFSATLATGEGPYLRTGDLGFVLDGELYVTGRLQDIIIVHGRNHYPQDVEATAERSDPALRPGCGAAFALQDAGGERLVVVHEVDTRTNFDPAAVIGKIRRAVSLEHDVRLHAVALLAPRSIPKTSSGKVQRQACSAAYLAKDLAVLAQWELEPMRDAARGATREADGEASDLIAGGGASASPEEVERWLVRRCSRLLGLAPQSVDIEEPVSALGLDSLGSVELLEDLSIWLGRAIPPELVWQRPSIRQLARVSGAGTRHTVPSAPETPRAPVKASAPAPFAFYQPFERAEYAERTNKHYALPARFFEVLTGGRWHTYSGNVWDGIQAPDPMDEDQQTRSQERKLDSFAELLELRPGMRVLDVGAGWGGPLVYLCKKYGVIGHGVSLSPMQVDYARRWIEREGVECRVELLDWQDLQGAGRFDAIMTDEVIVHFFHLDAFFRKAFELLRDGGILVNKELHFAHPAYARQPDAAMRFIGNLYGGVVSYRTLADELQLANQGGFRVEDIRQIQPVNYYLTAAAWHANLRRHECEMVDLVGAETVANYLKYLVYVMLSPGGKTNDPLPLFTHFVRCRKAPRHIREKLGG